MSKDFDEWLTTKVYVEDGIAAFNKVDDEEEELMRLAFEAGQRSIFSCGSCTMDSVCREHIKMFDEEQGGL